MDRNLTPLAIITQLGLTIVVSVVAGVLAGLWLDSLLGTKPVFTLVLSFIGVMAGALAGIRLVNGPAASAGRRTTQRRSPSSGSKSDYRAPDEEPTQPSTGSQSSSELNDVKPHSAKPTGTDTQDTEEKP